MRLVNEGGKPLVRRFEDGLREPLGLAVEQQPVVPAIRVRAAVEPFGAARGKREPQSGRRGWGDLVPKVARRGVPFLRADGRRRRSSGRAPPA